MAQRAMERVQVEREDERVVRLAAARVAGLTGEVRMLSGEHDVNARVGDGLVKLHSVATAPAELELQDAALRHLAEGPAAAYVPRLLASAPADPGSGDHPGAVRVLTWVPGRLWSELPTTPTPAQLGALGRLVATVDAALADFRHPAQHRALAWNLATASELVDRSAAVGDPDSRALVEKVLAHHAESVSPRLARLPVQVIHSDANDRNVVVDDDGVVRALIDFGDLVTAPRVCGLAIACAYATFGVRHPVRDVLPLVAGYHEVSTLSGEELELLLDLMRSRLATTVVMAAWQGRQQPDNAHLRASEADALRTLQRLDGESDVLALCRFRDACGYEPHPRAAQLRDWLRSSAPRPVMSGPMAELARLTLDWSAGAADPPREPDEVAERMARAGAEVAIGRYCEDRAVYQAPEFVDPDGGTARTVHLGVDLFAPAGTPVRAPYDGTVVAFHDNTAHLDYGPVIILEHRGPDGVAFYSLYGHLSRESLPPLRIGLQLAAGDQVATMGAKEVNGGWAPHVHFQLLLDLLGLGVDVPGVAPRAELSVWRSLSPDPDLVLRVPEGLDAMGADGRSRVADAT